MGHWVVGWPGGLPVESSSAQYGMGVGMLSGWEAGLSKAAVASMGWGIGLLEGPEAGLSKAP